MNGLGFFGEGGAGWMFGPQLLVGRWGFNI